MQELRTSGSSAVKQEAVKDNSLGRCVCSCASQVGATEDVEIAGFRFRDGEVPGLLSLCEEQSIEDCLRAVVDSRRDIHVGLPGGMARVEGFEYGMVHLLEQVSRSTACTALRAIGL